MSCHKLHGLSCPVMACHVMWCTLVHFHVMFCHNFHGLSCPVMACHKLPCTAKSRPFMYCFFSIYLVLSCNFLWCQVLSSHINQWKVLARPFTSWSVMQLPAMPGFVLSCYSLYQACIKMHAIHTFTYLLTLQYFFSILVLMSLQTMKFRLTFFLTNILWIFESKHSLHSFIS